MSWASELSPTLPELSNPVASLESYDNTDTLGPSDNETLSEVKTVLVPVLSQDSPLVKGEFEHEVEEKIVDLQSWSEVYVGLVKQGGVSKRDATLIKQRLVNNGFTLESYPIFANEGFENQYTTQPTQVMYTETVNTVNEARENLVDDLAEKTLIALVALKRDLNKEWCVATVDSIKTNIERVKAFNNIAKEHKFSLPAMDKAIEGMIDPKYSDSDYFNIAEFFKNVVLGEHPVCNLLLDENGSNANELFTTLANTDVVNGEWTSELEAIVNSLKSNEAHGDGRLPLSDSITRFDHDLVGKRVLIVEALLNALYEAVNAIPSDNSEVFKEHYSIVDGNEESIKRLSAVSRKVGYYRSLHALAQYILECALYIYSNLCYTNCEIMKGIAKVYERKEKLVPTPVADAIKVLTP